MRSLKPAFAIALLLTACGSKGAPKAPDNTTQFVPEAEAKKPLPCKGAELDLLASLIQSACEVPNPKPDAKPLDSKRLEIGVTPKDPQIEPGGALELTITYKNKGDDDLPLDFSLDPEPRFSIEAYDAKDEKRVDTPRGAPPKLPSGAEEQSTNTGTARVTLEPGGTAKVKVHWTATKMRWAPEKVKGSVPERGYPKAPAGPLGKGKYVLHLVSPLVNIQDGANQEITAPRVTVEVVKAK